ncbi:MAG: QacE [Rhodanobacter denitrificans]|uniref:QacE n=1 Tax=Rhodanobacter denitrificans TaxID=666685 RepID=A0A2W5KH83_9GAMM|nr:MAG: QacE [Rhodanobacter denitrificans]
MEEKIFFDRGGVSVSNARFIVNGQTYAMNGVTSVKQGVNNPSRAWPLLLGLLAIVVLLNEGSVWGGLLLVVAILWWVAQKPEWIVVLNSSSGETKALSSADQSYIKGVIEALNQSIIYRG